MRCMIYDVFQVLMPTVNHLKTIKIISNFGRRVPSHNISLLGAFIYLYLKKNQICVLYAGKLNK